MIQHQGQFPFLDAAQLESKPVTPLAQLANFRVQSTLKRVRPQRVDGAKTTILIIRVKDEATNRLHRLIIFGQADCY